MDFLPTLVTFLNPILIAIAGYYTKKIIDENDQLKKIVQQHEIKIALLTQKLESIEKLIQGIDTTIREKDARLIAKLEETITQLQNRKK